VCPAATASGLMMPNVRLDIFRVFPFRVQALGCAPETA
jgi:hypothetical protein